MDSNNANTHLTKEERRIIAIGIQNGSTKTAIATTIGKDNSTVGKEIKLHRVLKSRCKMPLECSNYKHCDYGRECSPECPDYVPFFCKRRDRSPGACNGCSNYSHCRFDKYVYDPDDANHEYRMTLVDSRVGYNVTTLELKRIADIIQPLLKQGLSPYAILQAHPEIGLSEKTLYTYIENKVFEGIADIGPLDLRRQVNRKLPKKKAKLYKKRKDCKHLIGRTFKEYKAHMEENPDTSVVQMDTVYNDESNGPFIQTFKFVDVGILFAFLQPEKTAETMKSGVDDLEEKLLGSILFRKHVQVLLTDRGSEFTYANAMEMDAGGIHRTNVFYCDPMQSGQKGTLENNHIALRYILPKGTDLYGLGLADQDALNLVLSHVNSIPLEKFGGKTPLEMAEFMYPDFYARLAAFGIRKVPADELILKPYLLKNRRSEKYHSNKKKRIASNQVSSATSDSNGVLESLVEQIAVSTISAQAPSSEEAIIRSQKVSEPGCQPRRHAGGRKPKSSALTDAEIFRMIADKCSPQEIADKMGVSVPTYYRRVAAIKNSGTAEELSR